MVVVELFSVFVVLLVWEEVDWCVMLWFVEEFEDLFLCNEILVYFIVFVFVVDDGCMCVCFVVYVKLGWFL